jgi:hypothetical protein
MYYIIHFFQYFLPRTNKFFLKLGLSPFIHSTIMQSILLLLLSVISTLVFSSQEVDCKLEIIGAGWGRTGTTSLCEALKELGYSTYHMENVLSSPMKMMPLWAQIYDAKGEEKKKILEEIFEGTNAMTDFPGSAQWETLLEMYPDAKVILTVRDFDSWFKSASGFILQFDTQNENMKYGIRLVYAFFPPLWNLQRFQKYLHLIHHPLTEIDLVRKSYEDWIEHVKKTVKPEQLLVLQVGKGGWKPLCDFLELGDKCPKTPFPHVNDSGQTWFFVQIFSIFGYVWTLFLFGTPSYLIWRFFLRASTNDSKKKAE